MPEAVDLGGERDVFFEDHLSALDVPVVDRDLDVRYAERDHRAVVHELGESRVSLLDRHQYASGSHAAVREHLPDAVELVQTDRRLANGRVAREHIPEFFLDVVDRRSVLSSLGEIGEGDGALFQRPLRPDFVRARDHERRLGAERFGHELDQPFSRAECLDVDEARVCELVRELVLGAGQHHCRLATRSLDTRCRLDERDDQARRFINMVDEFYDRNVKLVISAEVSLHELYAGGRLEFEFQRTQSRLLEMQSHDYLALEHRP